MKVALDAGHGGKHPGAVFGNVQEKDVVLSVCLYLQALLIDDGGFDVCMTRSIDKFLTLGDRVDIANEANAIIFISLHTNADADDDTNPRIQGKGEEIWIYKSGKPLAECLLPHVDEIFPNTKHRGIKTGSFNVIKYTNMPAVLIELGFVDNLQENDVFSNYENHKKMAILIFRGIVDYRNRLAGDGK